MKVLIGPYPKSHKTNRKISVRIDPHDTYSLDYTLAHIILPALKALKKNKHGAPGDLFDFSHHNTMKWGSPEFEAAEKKSSKEGFKKWDNILKEMIWSFDQLVRDCPGEPDFNSASPAQDKADYLAYHERLKNGFKLFGEWYQALWT